MFEGIIRMFHHPVISIIKAVGSAAKFFNKLENKKLKCIEPDCQFMRHEEYKYCAKHLAARENRGCLISIIVVILIVVAEHYL